MSLSLMSPLPDPRQRIEDLQRQLRAADERATRAESDLLAEKIRSSNIERGVQELRRLLSPFHQWVGVVFAEFDAMGISEMSASPAAKHSALWEDWKAKLDPQCAKAIDALLIHGEMNQTQLRLHVKCAKGSVAGIVFRLNRAGLINKNGGKISLKEL